MNNQQQNTDTRILLQYIASCADTSNLVPSFLILKEALKQLEDFQQRSDDANYSAWKCIGDAVANLQRQTGKEYWRQTPGYQVAAVVYILLHVEGLKTVRDEAFANDINQVLVKRGNFKFDKDAVDRTILEMKKYRQSSPPTINPMDICIEIGKGKNLAEIDWKVLLKEIIKYRQVFGKTYPYYMLLHGFMHLIPAAMRRVDVLGHLQDVASSCMKERESHQFIKEAGWLVSLYLRIHGLILDNPLPKIWKKELSWNEITLFIQHIQPEELVAIAQSIYESQEILGERIGIIPHILRHKQFINKLLTIKSVDFCRCLYFAYGDMMLMQSGVEDFRILPSIDNLNLELRNSCYDVFIRLRVEQLMTNLKCTNRRLYPPTIIDGYSALNKELAEQLHNFETYEANNYNKYAYDNLHNAILFLTQYAQDRYDELIVSDIQKKNNVVTNGQAKIVANNVYINQNHGPITSIEDSNVTNNK